jgi:hypothetical protein
MNCEKPYKTFKQMHVQKSSSEELAGWPFDMCTSTKSSLSCDG